MYIITVNFIIDPEHVDDFGAAVVTQADNSVNNEPGCEQFDVCIDPQNERHVFLYEVYRNEAAFEAHLASDHFKQFDALVRDWVQSKDVHTWTRVAAPSGS